MKGLAIVLLGALVALAVAVPGTPQFGESFQSSVNVELRLDGKIYLGQGQWDVNQVIGASLQKIQFPEAPVHDVHLAIRENFRYEMDQTQNSGCFAVPQRTLDTVFTWARGAEYAGIQTIAGIDMDIWILKDEHEIRTLTVPRNQNAILPVPHSLTILENTGRQTTYTFTRFSWDLVEDVEHFVRPTGCPMLRDDGMLEEEDTEVRFLNTTVGSLSQILAKAKEICTCGCPYVYGGNGPCCSGGRSGYDCSGLTTRAYAAGGVSIPRTASAQQRSGRSCSGGETAGDLIFFGNPAYHVVMSLGPNWAECPRTGLNCRITPKRAHDGGCRRIL